MGDPIDVLGIKINGLEVAQGVLGSARIVVAGQTIELSVIGSCLDRDTWTGNAGQIGTDTQAVDVAWTVGRVTHFGCATEFALGAPGSPGFFSIDLFADDDPTIPAGDAGTRDDDARDFHTGVTAIWVEIGLKMQGPMDDDDQGKLSFTPFPPKDRTLGGSENLYGVPGLHLKVELTGTVIPNVPDGTAVFRWLQTADFRGCAHEPNGTVSGSGLFSGVGKDAPEAENQTQATFNSEIFMIDAPGFRFAGLPSAVTNDKSIAYYNFTTWVTFNDVPASDKFDWHLSMGFQSDGTTWQGSWMSTADPGRDTVYPPTGNPPALAGGYPVDCSNQMWW